MRLQTLSSCQPEEGSLPLKRRGADQATVTAGSRFVVDSEGADRRGRPLAGPELATNPGPDFQNLYYSGLCYQ